MIRSHGVRCWVRFSSTCVVFMRSLGLGWAQRALRTMLILMIGIGGCCGLGWIMLATRRCRMRRRLIWRNSIPMLSGFIMRRIGTAVTCWRLGMSCSKSGWWTKGWFLCMIASLSIWFLCARLESTRVPRLALFVGSSILASLCSFPDNIVYFPVFV